MIRPAPRPGPHGDVRAGRIEVLVSVVLRVGVTASLLLIVGGTVVSFLGHPEYTSSPAELQRLTKPGLAFPHTPGQILDGVCKLRGQAIVTLGLVLLIATPVLRVTVSILAFMSQRDWTFMLITVFVLMVLLLSFAVGTIGIGTRR